jgi:serine/threonine-protein kinase
MTPPQRYRRLGKFELHGLIGEGAMGVVWKAYDSVLRRYVALKLLNTRVGKTQDIRERFLREARAAALLQHPNIVTVYDAGEADGQLFIAMELVEGPDLSDIIATSEPLPLERKLDLAIEVLDALHYAHQRGVIHRDVKPSNVGLAPDGRAKIMDFGIARLQSADVTGSGAIVGTPTYMAPEQITNGPITPATDVFAVGALLYELLTYRKPFEGDSVHGVLYQVLTTDPKPLRTVAPSIPASLERVVNKALTKVAEDRYESARQMQQTLEGIRAALSGAGNTTTQRLSARWTTLPAPILRLVSHTPMKWRAAVLSALVLVVGLLAYPSRPADDASAVPAGAETATAAPPAVSLPPGINPAVAALRDSALAARARAETAGAVKSGLPSALVGETLLETADRRAVVGDLARAAQGWREAVARYREAVREAAAERHAVATLIERVTPVVQALGTRPDGATAAGSLARAESLLTAGEFNLARLAAQNAERVGIEAGIAPPSAQPADPRAAAEILLADLARALATRRGANLRPLYPTISDAELRQWERFFATTARLTASYRIERFTLQGSLATAEVRAQYAFVERTGGAQREALPRLTVSLGKTANGWRITGVRER